MKRNELIKELQRYFNLRELVDEATWNKYGDFAWHFFRTELLETLLVVRRDILQRPISVNTWSTGGRFKERGLRHNLSAEVQKYTIANRQYMSAHCLGAGVDFDVKGLTAMQARQLIQSKANLLPHPIRLEEGVTWVHLDVYNDGSKGNVVVFRV